MEKRYVAIWFPFLVTDWYIRQFPLYKNVPLAAVLPLHGRMCITAVNRAAFNLGIHVNMVLADAKAAVPDLIIFQDTPKRSSTLLQKIGYWCIKYTPLIGLDGLGGLILDSTGCTHLWGGEKAYLSDIQLELSQRGYTVKVAVANTIGAAWALARYGNHNLPIDSPNINESLNSLPPEALRLEKTVIDRLYKLGLNTLDRFMNIPLSSLRRRFGAELVQRIEQFNGTREECIHPLKALDPYEEKLPCMEPIRTAKGIEIAIEKLVNRICNRLAKEGKGIRKAKMISYRVDGKLIPIEIGTNRPTVNKKHLLDLFVLQIQMIEPALGIELFTLHASHVEDLALYQERLWAVDRTVENKKLAELLDRLRGRDMDCHIHRYLPDEHHWPERAIRTATSLFEEATIPWPSNCTRPTRLLHPPEPVMVTAPIPDCPPLMFRYQDEVHYIKRADGPERIEREWWLEQGEHRDYYAVEDVKGNRYWLFRLGHYLGDRSPNWYLHGFFA